MRLAGRILGTLKIGRGIDWFWFNLARLRSPGRITADGLPRCDYPLRLDVKKGASLHIGRDVKFRSGFHCYVERGGHLEIGNAVLFSGHNWIACLERVTIGDACMFGPQAKIVDADHAFADMGKPIWQQGTLNGAVDIGEDTWIGAGAIVVKTSVGAHSVVGANAVVTKEIPPKSIAVGVPARVIKTRDGGTPQ